MIRLKPRHVRTRLTLWYVGVLSAVLGVFVVGTSGFLFLNLRSELDRNTIQDLETMEGLLNFAPDGTVRLSTDVTSYSRPSSVWSGFSLPSLSLT